MDCVFPLEIRLQAKKSTKTKEASLREKGSKDEGSHNVTLPSVASPLKRGGVSGGMPLFCPAGGRPECNFLKARENLETRFAGAGPFAAGLFLVRPANER